MGQPVTCTCSSDLKPTLIEWYMTGQSTSVCSQQFITSSRSDFGSNDFVFMPTTDDHGKTLVCVTTTPYGKQNTSKDVEVEGNGEKICVMCGVSYDTSYISQSVISKSRLIYFQEPEAVKK